MKRFLPIALSIFALFFLIGQTAPQPAPPKPPPPSVIPENARRPSAFTSPIPPRDLSIGDLGAGDADTDAYRFVRQALNAVKNSEKNSVLLSSLPQKSVDNIITETQKVDPRKIRVGGGQIGVDGSTSFMFRFIGREAELVGAIYVHIDGNWKIEDIILEEPRSIESARNSDNPYLWLPYDRFY